MRFSPLLSLMVTFLFAGNASASQLTIFWDDNSTNETGFKIERSVNGTAFAPLASTGADVTSFVDTSVAAGSSYAYRIQAFNVVTVSSFSNVASSTVPISATPPAITTQPASQTVMAGSTASLHVDATTTSALTFQWKKNDSILAGQTTSALTLSPVSVADQAAYVCVVSNSAGSVVSSAAVITVMTRPTFVVQPASTTALLGKSVALSVAVTGSPAPTLQWLKNDVAIGGAIGSTLSLSNVTASDAGTYSVVAKNSAGSSTSQNAVLIVSGEKPVITTQPIARIVSVGEDVSFVAMASGNPAPVFQWMKNNVAIPGASAATLNLHDVTQTDVATYSVIATNSAGSTISSNANLALSQPGKITHVIAKAVSSGWGNAALQMTFDVRGGPKSVLFRAIGPSLASFTSANLLVDPTLKLSGGTIVYTNNNWGGTAILKDAFAQVGAFPLANTSKDSAILAQLPARKYSAVLGGKATGMALAELYDVDPPAASSSHLSEVAVRGLVGKGTAALTVGFEISGDAPVRFLVRVIGPSLPHLQNLVKDPRLDIYKGSTLICTNDNWGGSASMISLFKQVGASPLAASSKDCATEITLSPGIYSAVVSGVNGSIGIARIEFRVLP